MKNGLKIKLRIKMENFPFEKTRHIFFKVRSMGDEIVSDYSWWGGVGGLYVREDQLPLSYWRIHSFKFSHPTYTLAIKHRKLLIQFKLTNDILVSCFSHACQGLRRRFFGGNLLWHLFIFMKQNRPLVNN